MAPLLPKGTLAVWLMLKRKEWTVFYGVVSVSLYNDYDVFIYGRMINITEESFTLVWQNPAYDDLVIEWSNVVHIIALQFRVGDRIEAGQPVNVD